MNGPHVVHLEYRIACNGHFDWSANEVPFKCLLKRASCKINGDHGGKNSICHVEFGNGKANSRA